MAAPVVRGGIVKAIVVFVIVLAVVVGGVAALANVTPNELGLGGVSIQGKTLAEQGLADYKIKDLIAAIKDLTAESDKIEEKVVTNQITEEASASAEKTLTESESVTTDADGKVDYTKIYDGKVIYTESKQIEYKDNEIGAIVNNILGDVLASARNNDSGILLYANNRIPSNVMRASTQFSISDLNVKIRELSIQVTDKINLRIIVNFDLTKFTSDPDFKAFLDQINGTGIITIPDPLKIVVEANIDIVHDKASNSVTVGSSSTVLVQNNQVLTNTLFALAGDQANQIKDAATSQIGGIFCRIVNNLGKVTSIENGKIVMQTYTAADK